jgi:hypothetical protein
MFVMDFNQSGDPCESTIADVEAAIQAGVSVALVNWPSYDCDVTKPLRPAVRQMAQEGKVRIVAPGETVRASTVIVGAPFILQHVIDLCPEVDCDSLIVLVSRMAAKVASRESAQYAPDQVRTNLKEVFGTEGLWIPISKRVRGLMEQDERYPPPQSETWTPLINTDTWCAQPRWRGRERRRPFLGRHACDHFTKWPSKRETLLAAYCADKHCEVAIMGGAQSALKLMGTQPENWQILEFGSVGLRDYLSDLDFFVHYPHEDHTDEFGRSVIEAMAVGVPAVLPPAFREIFGGAAIYAQPEDVWAVVERLWHNENAYLSRISAGRNFVLTNCGYDQLKRRLEHYEKRDNPADIYSSVGDATPKSVVNFRCRA